MTNYSQTANPNATNSELDAKVIITPDHVTLNQNVNKYPRLNDNEWDEILKLIDIEQSYIVDGNDNDNEFYNTLRRKLLAYRAEDDIINKLCDTPYDSIPQRY
tara:strand:- start:875 stop:1183 length:309 start_codon:yes stop_codon:yes gene_type:complete